jgi:hypothetical protein
MNLAMLQTTSIITVNWIEKKTGNIGKSILIGYHKTKDKKLYLVL